MSHGDRLLDIICCPVTHSPLERLGAAELERLNALIAEALEDALVTRDGKLAYPIRDGIPVLLSEQGISMAQLDSRPPS